MSHKEHMPPYKSYCRVIKSVDAKIRIQLNPHWVSMKEEVAQAEMMNHVVAV